MPPKNKKVYKSDRKTQKLKGKLAKDKNKTQKKKAPREKPMSKDAKKLLEMLLNNEANQNNLVSEKPIKYEYEFVGFKPIENIDIKKYNSLGKLMNASANELFKLLFKFYPSGIIKVKTNGESQIYKQIDNSRQLWELSSPTTQCNNSIGKVDLTKTCYICGLPLGIGAASFSSECEHILPISQAVLFLQLYHTNIDKKFSDLYKKEYAWSHSCCNRVKSDTSFVKYNEKQNKFVSDDVSTRQILNSIWESTNINCKVITPILTRKYKKNEWLTERIKSINENQVYPIVEHLNKQQQQAPNLFLMSYLASALSQPDQQIITIIENKLEPMIRYSDDIIVRHEAITDILNSFKEFFESKKNEMYGKNPQTSTLGMKIRETMEDIFKKILPDYNEKPDDIFVLLFNLLVNLVKTNQDINLSFINYVMQDNDYHDISSDKVEKYSNGKEYMKYKIIKLLKNNSIEEVQSRRRKVSGFVDFLDEQLKIFDTQFKEIPINLKLIKDWKKNPKNFIMKGTDTVEDDALKDNVFFQNYKMYNIEGTNIEEKPVQQDTNIDLLIKEMSRYPDAVDDNNGEQDKETVFSFDK